MWGAARSPRRRVTLLALRRESTRAGAAPEQREFSGDSAKIPVGRSAENLGDPNRFYLANDAASSEHGLFRRRAGDWSYRDLNSSNGSWHNGEPIGKREIGPIFVGDRFCFGDESESWVVFESTSTKLPAQSKTRPTRRKPVFERAPLASFRLDVALPGSKECGPEGPPIVALVRTDADQIVMRCDLPADTHRRLLAQLAVAKERDPNGGWVLRRDLCVGMGWRPRSRAINNCLTQLWRRLSKLTDLRGFQRKELFPEKLKEKAAENEEEETGHEKLFSLGIGVRIAR